MTWPRKVDAGEPVRSQGKVREVREGRTAQPVAEALRLHARLPVYRRHVEQARRVVRESLVAGPVAVAFSGGKDSMVTLHLAHTLDARVGGYFFDSGCETEWTYAAVEGMRARGIPVTTIRPEYSIVEMIQIVGGLGYTGSHRWHGDWHWGRGDFRRVLLDEPDRRARALLARSAAWRPGEVTMLLGLRAEESRGRHLALARRGSAYRRVDGRRVACPLAWWSGRDVLAYAVTQGLPLSQEYQQPDDDLDSRARRRTGTALGATAVGVGRWARLRHEHPILWQRLTAMFPDLRMDA